MGPDASALKTLGLEPGADAAAIEAAYRRLIKLHHPDRQGGDAARAAEINRAYRQLRDGRRLLPAPKATRPVARQQAIRSRSSLGRWLVPGVAVAAAIAAVSAGVPRQIAESFRGLGEPLRYEASRGGASKPLSSFSEVPLDSDAIDRAVAEAMRIAQAGDHDRLSSQSRSCHAALRREPTLTRLDQCVAFDEAVVALMKDDVIAESGQFGTSAVTGRQLASSRLFPGGYFELESRLDQIRARVEFTLAPPDPAPPGRDSAY